MQLNLSDNLQALDQFLRQLTYLQYCMMPELFQLKLQKMDKIELKNTFILYFQTLKEFNPELCTELNQFPITIVNKSIISQLCYLIIAIYQQVYHQSLIQTNNYDIILYQLWQNEIPICFYQFLVNKLKDKENSEQIILESVIAYYQMNYALMNQTKNNKAQYKQQCTSKIQIFQTIMNKLSNVIACNCNLEKYYFMYAKLFRKFKAINTKIAIQQQHKQPQRQQQQQCSQIIMNQQQQSSLKILTKPNIIFTQCKTILQKYKFVNNKLQQIIHFASMKSEMQINQILFYNTLILKQLEYQWEYISIKSTIFCNCLTLKLFSYKFKNKCFTLQQIYKESKELLLELIQYGLPEIFSVLRMLSVLQLISNQANNNNYHQLMHSLMAIIQNYYQQNNKNNKNSVQYEHLLQLHKLNNMIGCVQPNNNTLNEINNINSIILYINDENLLHYIVQIIIIKEGSLFQDNENICIVPIKGIIKQVTNNYKNIFYSKNQSRNLVQNIKLSNYEQYLQILEIISTKCKNNSFIQMMHYYQEYVYLSEEYANKKLFHYKNILEEIFINLLERIILLLQQYLMQRIMMNTTNKDTFQKYSNCTMINWFLMILVIIYRYKFYLTQFSQFHFYIRSLILQDLIDYTGTSNNVIKQQQYTNSINFNSLRSQFQYIRSYQLLYNICSSSCFKLVPSSQLLQCCQQWVADQDNHPWLSEDKKNKIRIKKIRKYINFIKYNHTNL